MSAEGRPLGRGADVGVGSPDLDCVCCVSFVIYIYVVCMRTGFACILCADVNVCVHVRRGCGSPSI